MEIIIDSRMRKIEKEYLSQFGKLIEILPQDSVYDEISAHPDIFFCKINDKIIKEPSLQINVGIDGKENVLGVYPEDVKYNVCQIGKYVVHNFDYTDKKILEIIEKEKLIKINVKQGYSNCSICTINNNACLTSDIGIFNSMISHDIDCLFISNTHIKLLDKNGLKTKINGFIGGACCVINNNFILFGDSNLLENKNELVEFINKYNLKFVDFKNLEIHDYGGVILL